MDNKELDSLIADIRSGKIDRNQAVFEKLIRLLQLAKWEFGQWGYYRVLLELANESALDPLIALVQEGGAIWIASDAIDALGKIGGPEATNALIAALEDRALRRHALFALADIGGPQAVSILIEALRFDLDNEKPNGDSDALYAAQISLEYMRNTALEPLIAALNHENSNVRYNAAEILGKIQDPSAIEPLKAALDKEQNKENQDNLRRVLEKMEKDNSL